MAEYAVVLGVITLAVVGVFTALSGGISSAITNVTGYILPGSPRRSLATAARKGHGAGPSSPAPFPLSR